MVPQQRLSEARTVIKHAPDLAEQVLDAPHGHSLAFDLVNRLAIRPGDRHLTAHLAKLLRALDGDLSRFEFGCIPSTALAKERPNDVPHPCVPYSQAREIFYKKKTEKRKAHDCRRSRRRVIGGRAIPRP
jgi:hypothetical protein